MFKMKYYAGEKFQFHGFTLKRGFFYGIETETGRYVATSGWESGENVAIYFLEDNNKWKLYWIAEDSVFNIEDLPEIKKDNKMSFGKWLKAECGIDASDWDENYSGTCAEQIEREYDAYYFEHLPRFAQAQLLAV